MSSHDSPRSSHAPPVLGVPPRNRGTKLLEAQHRMQVDKVVNMVMLRMEHEVEKFGYSRVPLDAVYPSKVTTDALERILGIEAVAGKYDVRFTPRSFTYWKDSFEAKHVGEKWANTLTRWSSE